MDNLLNINDYALQITAETVIPINHCLVSKAGSIQKLKKLFLTRKHWRNAKNS